MKRKHAPLIAAAFVALGTSALCGQATPPPATEREHTMGAKAKAAAADTDVTYGRIKEMTAGQKVVIDVDDAMDKTYDLTDKDVNIKVAKGLKVGDPVKITEHDAPGKNKSVMITKHTGGGVKHGDKDTASRKP